MIKQFTATSHYMPNGMAQALHYYLSMRVLFCFIMTGLMVGCGQGGGNSAPATAASLPITVSSPTDPTQPPTLIPQCQTILKCIQQCATSFPYTTDIAIQRTCAAAGDLDSTYCNGLIAANENAQAEYNLCLTKPANQVISYP